MTYIEALKSNVEALGMKFIHADPYDQNLGVDNVNNDEFPVFVLVTPRKTPSKVNDAGMITRKPPIASFILYRIDGQQTIEMDTTTAQVWIQKACRLADNLIHRLNLDPLTDTETKGITDFACDEVYYKDDATLFGAGLTFGWPVNEQTRGC